MVNPVGGPSTPSTPTGDSSTTSGTSPFQTDSSEVWIPLGTFAELMMSSSRRLKEALLESEQNNALGFASASLGLVDQLQYIGQLNQKILSTTNLWTAIYNQQVQQQQAIQKYNTNSLPVLTSAAQQFNNAAQAYESVNPSTPQSRAAWNNAITTYNNTAGPIVNAYNATVTAYNNMIAQVPQLNQQLAQLNFKVTIPQPANLPYISSPPSDMSGFRNVSPTVSVSISLPLPSLAQISSLIPTPVTPSNVVGNIVQQVVTAVSTAQGQLDMARQVQDKLTELNPDNFVLPSAYIKSLPPVFFNASSASVGTGATLTGIIMGLASRDLPRILGNAAYDAVLQQIRIPPNSQLLDKFQLLATQVLGQLAISGASSANAPVANAQIPITEESTPLSIGNALGFLTATRDLVNSGTTLDTVQKLIDTTPELAEASVEAKNTLVQALTPIFNSVLLQVAISQLGIVLGTPGLLPQILANVPGLPTPSATSPDVDHVLDNPVNQLLLKSKVSQVIKQRETFAPGDADSIANRIVNNILLNKRIENAQILQEQIVPEAVRNENLNPELSSAIADAAKTFVETEIAIPVLNQPIPENVPTAALAATLTTNTSVPPSLLDSILQQTLADRNIENLRDFREAVLNNLLATPQVPTETAYNIANTLPALIVPPQQNESPLYSPTLTEKLPKVELAESLNGIIFDQLKSTVNPERARVLADQVVRTLIGPNSILTTYNEQVRNLRDQQQESALSAVANSQTTLNDQGVVVQALHGGINQIIYTALQSIQGYMDPIARSKLTTSKPLTDIVKDLDIRI